MDKIADYENDGIQFGRVTTVFEIFSSPLPSHIDMDGVLQDVEDANDLFRASIHFGFDELYLPDRETVAAKSGDKDLEFSTVDFVRWQLVRMNSETIYYLINKIDFSVDGFMDAAEEYDRDETYDLDSWLSEYDEDTKSHGVSLTDRMRHDKADGFYGSWFLAF